MQILQKLSLIIIKYTLLSRAMFSHYYCFHFRFYLPHGLTVDKQGNIWVTDVGLHQVFRFPPGSDTPDMTLGERFIPGTDQKHFCKPTDVAVMSNGDFFVSDG